MMFPPEYMKAILEKTKAQEKKEIEQEKRIVRVYNHTHHEDEKHDHGEKDGKFPYSQHGRIKWASDHHGHGASGTAYYHDHCEVCRDRVDSGEMRCAECQDG